MRTPKYIKGGTLVKKPYTLLNKAEPYLWILPSIILMFIFIIVPIGYALTRSGYPVLD